MIKKVFVFFGLILVFCIMLVVVMAVFLSVLEIILDFVHKCKSRKRWKEYEEPLLSVESPKNLDDLLEAYSSFDHEFSKFIAWYERELFRKSMGLNMKEVSEIFYPYSYKTARNVDDQIKKLREDDKNEKK